MSDFKRKAWFGVEATCLTDNADNHFNWTEVPFDIVTKEGIFITILFILLLLPTDADASANVCYRGFLLEDILKVISDEGFGKLGQPSGNAFVIFG